MVGAGIDRLVIQFPNYLTHRLNFPESMLVSVTICQKTMSGVFRVNNGLFLYGKQLNGTPLHCQSDGSAAMIQGILVICYNSVHSQYFVWSRSSDMGLLTLDGGKKINEIFFDQENRQNSIGFIHFLKKNICAFPACQREKLNEAT